MRIIVPFLIALFAIMGIAAAAIDHVELVSPHDGDVFSVKDTIKIRSKVSCIDCGQIFGRMFINDKPVYTSNWVPTEAGEYTIMIEVADNKGFINPISDTVTIKVN